MKKLTIIGLGLMGASIAWNAKKARVAETIVGFDQRRSACNIAMDRHFVDATSTSLKKVIKDTDLVIIAVPVSQMETIMQQLNSLIAKNTVVTDVGSTKQSVINDAKEYLTSHLSQFVPGHPVTGSERQGGENAIKDLFQKSKIILTPTEKTHPTAIKLVEKFWKKLGAKTEIMPADEHDKILALTSHLPHILAMAFMNANNENSLNYVGGGFKSFTRIAQANADIWSDILIANCEAIIEQLTNFRNQLDNFETAIANTDRDLITRLIKQSKNLREKIA